MNIEGLRHRTKTMSSIYIATMTHIIIQTPAQFVILTFLPIMLPERSKIMNIGTLRANYLTKHSMLCHI